MKLAGPGDVGAVELGGRETASDGQRMEDGELAPDIVQTLWYVA